jgi:hypothetical protein
MAEGNRRMITVVLGLVVLVLAAGSGWLVWQTLAPVRSMDTWPKAAQRMGLEYVPMPGATTIHPGSIRGTYQGHAVAVEATGRVRQTYLMTVTVKMNRPLGAGLRLESDPALREEIADRRTYFSFFDDEFARRFHPRAYDEERAVPILSNGMVTTEFSRLSKKGKGIRASDDEIVYFADSVETDPAELEELVVSLVGLATRMENLIPR